MSKSNPGRCKRTVFKVYSGKLPYSQNILEGCMFCHAQRGPKEKPLSLCAGCRSVRFCSREHQIQFWPKHKYFCKEQTNLLKYLDKLQKGPHEPNGLPSPSERKVIVEDWLELHRHSIEEALASAVYTTDPPVNFKTQFADFALDYRVESRGNPSTVYTLRSVKLLTEPKISPNTVFRNMVEDTNAQDQAKFGYVGFLICVFWYNGNNIPSLTAMAIVKGDLRPISIAEHMDWFLPLQRTINQGVVYRLIGPSEREWTPGLTEKQDDKHWVWRPTTPKELEEKGIRL